MLQLWLVKANYSGRCKLREGGAQVVEEYRRRFEAERQRLVQVP